MRSLRVQGTTKTYESLAWISHKPRWNSDKPRIERI